VDTKITTVHIRAMQERDIPAVREIDRMSFSLPWPERAYRYEITKTTTSLLYVAELDEPGEDGRVVGMVVAWLVLDEAHIATIAVHPDLRRQGIAEKLLLVALEKSLQNGATQAMLEVRTSNLAARNLYHRFDFEVVGRRPRYYRDNHEDAVLMNLEVLDQAYIQKMHKT
jgi:ribosomal-protein-alanine N-acetyltransferase